LMDRPNTRRMRRVQPKVESLEGRQLLSSSARHSTGSDPSPSLTHDARVFPPPPRARQITYGTPQGAQVVVTIIGAGSLAGSSVDPSTGALNLVYGDTNENTAIISRVRGGDGQAPLASIHNANVAINDLSGIGGTALFQVNLHSFNLVPDGQINL